MAYLTAHKKQMIEFLKSHLDEQFSATMLLEEIPNCKMSLSAMYRNLAALEDEGFISRRFVDGSREAFYQYTSADECQICIHIACKICGTISHIPHKLTQKLNTSIKKDSGFIVDTPSSIIYGVCKNCIGERK